MPFIKLLALAALCAASVCSAEIGPLVLDNTISSKGRTPNKHIVAAHDALPNIAGTSAAARLAILYSLTGRAGEMFYLEGEGDNYVDARFDTKRNPLWLRIEYSDKYIQIRYLDGQKDFVCTINRDGICYNNHDHFYHYAAYLRKSIRNRLARLAKASPEAVDLDHADVEHANTEAKP
ncbi:MAG: hypothetical protein H7Y02_07435 [Candidatus Obscuribacterales bacterium]|nr:hypothetical protein [Steroidobacteraceae bacterium]